MPSPAAGSTGTIPLPPSPVGAALSADQRALPFRIAGASLRDSGRALQCLTAAIYYEAATESDDGERAVAQVVLNRVRHPAFPPTVCGVVYQGSDRPGGCQFSFACDGAIARPPSRNGWARALRIAADALTGRVYAPVGLATHYHTYAVTPAWNRTLVMTDAIGAHFFHRWKGYWGTSAAFTRVYRGGEPVPGPSMPPEVRVETARLPTPLPARSDFKANAATSAAAELPADQIQPAYAISGTLRDDRGSASSSQILDKWKYSGQPRD